MSAGALIDSAASTAFAPLGLDYMSLQTDRWCAGGGGAVPWGRENLAGMEENGVGELAKSPSASPSEFRFMGRMR
jgi:hypothetical protein